MPWSATALPFAITRVAIRSIMGTAAGSRARSRVIEKHRELSWRDMGANGAGSRRQRRPSSEFVRDLVIVHCENGGGTVVG